MVIEKLSTYRKLILRYLHLTPSLSRFPMACEDVYDFVKKGRLILEDPNRDLLYIDNVHIRHDDKGELTNVVPRRFNGFNNVNKSHYTVKRGALRVGLHASSTTLPYRCNNDAGRRGNTRGTEAAVFSKDIFYRNFRYCALFAYKRLGTR